MLDARFWCLGYAGKHLGMIERAPGTCGNHVYETVRKVPSGARTCPN